MGKKNFINKRKKKEAQTIVEYTVILGVIVTLLVAASPLLKRSIQGMVRLVADQVGNQQNAEQPGGEAGHLVDSYTITRVDTDKRTIESLGSTNFIYDDRVRADTTLLSNQGFTERN